MRHTLIDEAKAELDTACESVRLAEEELVDRSRMMLDAFEQEPVLNEAAWRVFAAERDKALAILREGLGLSELHRIQRLAMNRFSLVSGAFEVIWTDDDPAALADAMTRYVFRAADIRAEPDQCRALAGRFSDALYNFHHQDDSDPAEQEVRDAWDDIEDRLRRFGRQI
ncbi:MAG: hypothetical protein AB7G39_07130 [Alphaproteobacteria bacterium]